MDDIYTLALLQYKQAPRVLGLIYALIGAPYERYTVEAEPLRTLYGIDESQGVQLDGIGGIIGQPRPKSFDDADIFAEGVFTLGDSNNPQPELDADTGFGDVNNPNVGGRWDRGAVEGLSLGDPEYQNLLKGRVFIRQNHGTAYDFERYGEIVFGAPASVYEYVGYVIVAFPYYLNQIAISTVLDTLKFNLGIRTGVASVPSPTRLPFGYAREGDGRPIEAVDTLLDEDGEEITTDAGVPILSTSIAYNIIKPEGVAGYAKFDGDPEGGAMLLVQ